MAVDRNSVSYMREYLKYALEFEKYVYIWSQAMDDANKQVRDIYENRKQLGNVKRIAADHLNNIDEKYERMLIEKRSDRNNSLLKSILLFFPTLIVFLVCMYIGLFKFEETPITENLFAKLLIGFVGFIVLGSIFYGPFLKNISKYISLNTELRQKNLETHKKRESLNLIEQKTLADNELENNLFKENELIQRQEEMLSSLQKAKTNLAKIYSENILPPKYRNINAVATFYEYLSTGRCNTVQGHGGIYDTYEVERIHLLQLQQMMEIKSSLSRIEDYQRYICRELNQVNNTLSSINSSLKEIEKTNAEIAKNTAISAVANQQSAASLRWMAWNKWANG